MKRRVLFLSIAVIAVVAFAFAGCSMFGNDDPDDTNDGDDDDSSTETSQTAPEDVSNFKGTAAFSDGTSAAIDLNVDISSSKSITAKASSSIEGKLIYDGTNYNIDGTFDTDTGKLSAEASSTSTSITFSIQGTYSATEGFEGTVKRTEDNSTKEGNVVLKESESQDEAEQVINFLGTFRYEDKPPGGSWNFTISENEILGTWSYTDGTDGSNYGIIKGSRSNDSVSLTAYESDGEKVSSGDGTISGTKISGEWTSSDGSDSGTWSGEEVE